MKKNLIRFLQAGIMIACIAIGIKTGDGFKAYYIECIKDAGATVVTGNDAVGAWFTPLVVMICFGWFVCKLIDED